MNRIFISYRRSDSSTFAAMLARELDGLFEGACVFFDKSSIDLGKDYEKVIDDALSNCAVFIPVIGSRWLARPSEVGDNRLFERNDLVRIELETAAHRQLWTIPILADGAVMPTQHDLPESVAWVTKMNALAIATDDMKTGCLSLVEPIQQAFEFAEFQKAERAMKVKWAEHWGEIARDGRLMIKGDRFLCMNCLEYFVAQQNNFSSCSYHAELPESIGEAGAAYDHATIWRFPCCGKTLKGAISKSGRDVAPGQSPGCYTAMHRPYDEVQDAYNKAIGEQAGRDEAAK